MDINKNIKEGESESVEYKESLRLKDEIGVTISSFSNSKGGVILIGVSDASEIKGVEIGKKTLTDMAEYIKRNTDPPIYPEITIHQIEDKKVMFIKIKESVEKPVFFRNHVYKRVGNTNQRIASQEIRKLAQKPKKLFS